MPIEIGISGAVAPTERVTIPWPDITQGPPINLDVLREANFLSRSIGWLSGLGWRDSSGIYNPTGTFAYAVPVRDAFGKISIISPKPTGYTAEDETFNFFGPTVQKYMLQHSKAIGGIPRLRLVVSNASAAASFHTTDLPVAVLIRDPLGPIAISPSGHAVPSPGPAETNLRTCSPFDGSWFIYYDPDTNGLRYSLIQGFAADDAAPAPPSTLTDIELANAALDILISMPTKSLAEKGAMIRAAARA